MEVALALALSSMIVLAFVMAFVPVMHTVRANRTGLQTIAATRAALEFVLEESRGAGGPDLPEGARVLIDKGGGARGSDVLFILDEAVGYSTCGITGASGSTLTFRVVTVSGTPRCCFEAGTPPALLPPVQGTVPPGAPFRRTAVIVDAVGRFLPVFLEGRPSAGACQLQMKALPGVSRVINAAARNEPTLLGATAVLADVKRVYLDFAADGVRTPVAALYVHNEQDGDVNDFTGERQRISSSIYDLRFAVGYGDQQPEVPPPEDDEEDNFAPLPPEVAPGANPLIELTTARGGWRDQPLPVVAGDENPPQMLGVGIMAGVRGSSTPPLLPWSAPRPSTPTAQTFPLVGRVAFREGGRP